MQCIYNCCICLFTHHFLFIILLIDIFSTSNISIIIYSTITTYSSFLYTRRAKIFPTLKKYLFVFNNVNIMYAMYNIILFFRFFASYVLNAVAITNKLLLYIMLTVINYVKYIHFLTLLCFYNRYFVFPYGKSSGLLFLSLFTWNWRTNTWRWVCMG